MPGSIDQAVGATRPESRKRLVMAAVLVTMSMVSIESTIVATAVPQIVADLGGLRLYSWVFASFLLTQTAGTVVFGKLADIYGVRSVILVGMSIFLIGSVLCGFAWSMPALIGFRLIQGLGAGAVQPIALTIVADLFPGRQRGRVQGYLATVWAVSAVLGPIAGALIVHAYSWSWIFWMNVPLGILGISGFAIFLDEKRPTQNKPVDVAGAVLFVASTASLMIGLTAIAMRDSQTTAITAIILVVSVFLLIGQERRAPDPLLSYDLWSRRAIAATNAVAVFASMSLIGLTTFLPIYVQGVLNRSPVEAGLALTMVMVGWPTGATIAARIFDLVGLSRLVVAGSLLIPAGAIILVQLTPQSSPILAGLGSLVMGFGMGLVSVSSLVLIQEVADRSQRAAATASTMFSRNLGSALGASLLGAVLNVSLGQSDHGHPVRFEDLERAFGTMRRGQATLDPIMAAALNQGLHNIFVMMLLLSVIVVAMAMLIPSVTVSKAEAAA